MVTGPGNALREELAKEDLEAVTAVHSAVLPASLTSVIAVVQLVTMPRIVTSRTSATAAGKVATSPKTVLSLNNKKNNAVTPAVDQATWLETVTNEKCRSATLAVNRGTSKKTVHKSGATGVVRPAIWP